VCVLGVRCHARDERGEVGVRAFAFHFCFDDEAVDFVFVGVVEAQDTEDGEDYV